MTKSSRTNAAVILRDVAVGRGAIETDDEEREPGRSACVLLSDGSQAGSETLLDMLY